METAKKIEEVLKEEQERAKVSFFTQNQQWLSVVTCNLDLQDELHEN